MKSAAMGVRASGRLSGAVSVLTFCAIGAAASACRAERPAFMGRTIARTMTHHGAGWLVRDSRQAEENTALLMQRLGLDPGQVACDVGAGNGYHSLKMAKAVAPSGQVVAVDIQPEMLGLLEDRAKAAGVTNVKTVLGAEDDPHLEAETCDLILLVDVYHEMQHPRRMLEAMKRALAPQGRIALVEFRANDPRVPIKPLHTMTKPQMRREFAAVGLEPVETFDGLPWQHLIFFGRAAAD